mmetsp:Transcript_381/g.469  ORF Transcript_381/g.469 Transcript_381/m.469 type:complete len:165 (+) Transcript_381:72-566(+)
MRAPLYLALLSLLFGTAAAFSVDPQTTANGVVEKRNNNPRSAIISAAVLAASLSAAQPSGAFVESSTPTSELQSNQIITSTSNMAARTNTQTTSTAPSSFISSLQLTNSLASPMGDFKPETDTGISPGFSTFGQWFFLLYVVVSLLAGAKEIGGRIMNQMNKDE